MGVTYERVEKTWSDLAVDDYVIDRQGHLWRLEAERDGAFLAAPQHGGDSVVWPAQTGDRPVAVAVLYPVDPLTLLRERMGATIVAWKPNGEGIWTAAPWYDTKPGNESIELYRSHIIEMHGFKPPVLDYPELRAYHLEHHTEGIDHKVNHVHPDRSKA